MCGWHAPRGTFIVNRTPIVPRTSMHRGVSGAAAAALIVALAAHAGLQGRTPRYPVPAAPLRALPSLSASDAAVREAVMKLHGAQQLAPMLAGDGLIARFVAHVDEVARGASAGCPALLERIAGLDSKAAAALYARMYPLLQQAYRERSPDSGYFNDRLVEAIDRLLENDAAPPAAAKLREIRKLLALRAPGA